MIHHWLCRLVELPPPCGILLKVTTLLAIGWALHLVLRRWNPYWRVLLWRGIGLAIIAIPLLAGIAPSIPIPVSAPAGYTAHPEAGTTLGPRLIDGPFVAPAPEASTPNANAPAVTVGPSLRHAKPIRDWMGDHWKHLLLAVWVAGLWLLILRWMAAWISLRGVMSVSTTAGEHEQQCLRRAARLLGCDAAVQLRLAENVAGPLLAGIRTPVILLPKRIARGAEPAELSAILAHELTHLRNRDLHWMAFLRTMAVICWWHPLTWIMCRAHSQSCEEVCDAVAAAHVGGCGAYSRTLARMALAALTPTPAVAGIPMARPAEIMQRLSRLARGVGASRPSPGRVAPAAILGAAMAVALSGLQFVYAITSPLSRWPSFTNATRVLHFPADQALGSLWVSDEPPPRYAMSALGERPGDLLEDWRRLGAAQGEVEVPAGRRIRLYLAHETEADLSQLLNLRPDDIDTLELAGTYFDDKRAKQFGMKSNPKTTDAVMPYVAHLTGLRSLGMRWTHVTNEGLRHLANLRSLEQLHLPSVWTRADDTTLERVSALPSLKRLFGANTGSVTPAGIARLAQMSTLEEFEFSAGDEAFQYLAKMPSLHTLWLSGNRITDAGVKHLKDIPSLHTLILDQTKGVTDAGMAELAEIKTLQRLRLKSMQHISDEGMRHIGRMTGLHLLHVSETGTTEKGFLHLRQLTQLTELRPPPVELSEEGLAILAGMKNLRSLMYGGRGRNDDKAMECIGGLSELEVLYTGGPNVTAAGIGNLGRLTRLRHLEMGRVDDDDLAGIAAIRSLETLRIGVDGPPDRDKFTTTGLSQLNALSNLVQLRVMSFKEDNGTLDLSNLKNLEEFEVRGSGVLHDDDMAGLAGLDQLGSLRIPNNLTDESLVYLATLKGLTELAIEGEFTERGLAHLAALPQLRSLRISGKGTTEAGLAQILGLTQLRSLSVTGTGLTDASLAQLSGLKVLGSLIIHGNITEQGLLEANLNPDLSYLQVVTPNRLSPDIEKKMSARLPRLATFRYGPDSRHMAGTPVMGFGGGG